MSIKNIIKRLLVRTIYIENLSDKVQYPNINDGYAGGSLASSNILVVCNKNVNTDCISEILDKEQCYYQIKKLTGLIAKDNIITAGKSLIGPFTHIINLFFPENNGTLINDRTSYNMQDSFYKFYQWHQEEVDYLVQQNQYASICSCFIYEDNIDGCIKKKNAEMCIRGLAEVLSNHGMICNGITASSDIPIETLINSSIYLSSKYGQIMTGEVLDLKV